MNINKTIILSGLAFAVFLPLAASADIHTIKPGMAGKWNKAESYEENELPAAGDTIRVAMQTSVQADASDFDFIEATGISAIEYEMGGSGSSPMLTVDVDKAKTTSFSGQIVNSTSLESEDYAKSGTLVKKGEGRLELKCGTTLDAYRSSFRVDAGVLKLPASTQSYRNRHYLRMTVNDPGVLILTTASENYNTVSTWCYDGLWGDGTITNDSSRRAYVICCSRSGNPIPTFSGKICSRIRVQMDGAYHQSFTRPQNGSADVSPLITSSADLRLQSIGGTFGGGSNVGSLGSQYIEVGQSPTITYLGSGETSYAEFRGNADQKKLTLDGGANGGFDHRGLANFSAATKVATALVLDGDFPSANPCTIGSVISNAPSATRTTRLVKRGTGTWNLVENPKSGLNGVVAVEDGTLTFDTLASAGGLCALGWATTCQSDYDATAFDPSKSVDYAVLLGTSSTTGTLTYVGTDATPLSARTIALAGEGRLSSATAPLNWSGITSADTGTHTIRLGGPADGSVVRDISDGTGKVRVVKEGSGALTLGGVLDFTGGLEVKAGSLAISSVTNMNYSWYRILIKERRGGELADAEKNVFNLSRVSLFDGDGHWINTNLVANASANGAAWRLKPGETALSFSDPNANASAIVNNNRSFDALFLGETGNAYWGFYNSADIPSLYNTNAWVGVAFRMPAGSAAAKFYDLGTRWDPGTASEANYPQSWTVQGSFDGVNWTDLSSVVSNTYWASSHNRWIKRNVAFNPATANKSGWPIATGEDRPTAIFERGIDDIAVAAGSALRTETEVVVRKVTVDAVGMGTISGFSLAENGVIDIVNAPERGAFKVSVDFSGMTIPENAVYRVNGKSDKRQLRISDDGKTWEFLPKGLVLVVR